MIFLIKKLNVVFFCHKFLCGNHSNVNFVNRTPMSIAFEKGNTEIINLLMQHEK